MKKQILIFYSGGNLQFISDEKKINALDKLLKEKPNQETFEEITPFMPEKNQKTDKISVRPSTVNAIVITEPKPRIMRPPGGAN